jgi:hypothetical protein
MLRRVGDELTCTLRPGIEIGDPQLRGALVTAYVDLLRPTPTYRRLGRWEMGADYCWGAKVLSVPVWETLNRTRTG